MTRPKMTYELAARLLTERGVFPSGDLDLEYEQGLKEILIEISELEYKQNRLIEEILHKAKLNQTKP